jgi:hypothetical protein
MELLQGRGCCWWCSRPCYWLNMGWAQGSAWLQLPRSYIYVILQKLITSIIYMTILGCIRSQPLQVAAHVVWAGYIDTSHARYHGDTVPARVAILVCSLVRWMVVVCVQITEHQLAVVIDATKQCGHALNHSCTMRSGIRRFSARKVRHQAQPLAATLKPEP